MLERANVEAAIQNDEALLCEVARLITARVDLASWPLEARNAFVLALAQPDLPLPEAWKQLALQRHLFGQPVPLTTTLPTNLSSTIERQAEHLRGNLSSVVEFRAGAHLR